MNIIEKLSLQVNIYLKRGQSNLVMLIGFCGKRDSPTGIGVIKNTPHRGRVIKNTAASLAHPSVGLIPRNDKEGQNNEAISICFYTSVKKKGVVSLELLFRKVTVKRPIIFKRRREDDRGKEQSIS